MSDEILKTIISTIGGIISALITALIPVIIPVIMQNERPKPKINWPFILFLALGIGIITGCGIYLLTKPKTLDPAIALSDAKIEFIIKDDDRQISIPAGNTLDALHAGDTVTIETIVTDTNGNAYPHDIAFTYYYASGKNYSGNVLPYLAERSDIITIQIEDQVTGETATRTLQIDVEQ